jgi:cbb3-type cytochrome oxidase subunit 3
MTYLIFGGDMLVMAFMISLIVWLSVRSDNDEIDAAARIPLDDELGDSERDDG